MQFFNNFKTIFLIIVFHQLQHCHAQNRAQNKSLYAYSDFEIPTKSVIDTMGILNSHINSLVKHFSNNDTKLQATEIISGITKRNKIDDLDETIRYLCFFDEECMKCMMSEFCSSRVKNTWIRDVIYPASKYRATLSSVIKIYGINGGLLNLVLDYFKSSGLGAFNCGSKTSIQMNVNNVISYLLMAILQHYGLVFLIFRHVQNDLKNKRQNAEAAEELRGEMEQVLGSLKFILGVIVRERQTILLGAPSDIRTCDPPRHIKHVTYERLTHFIQGFVGSEEFLRTPTRAQTCNGNCASILERDISINLSETEKNYFAGGKVFDCTVAPDFNYIYKQINPLNDERLYHYLSNEKSNTTISFGRTYVPPGTKVAKYSRDNFGMWRNSKTVTSKNCQSCLCNMDRVHTENATRSFSQAAVIVPDGNVVTGVRWVVKNHIVRLELQGMKYSENKLFPSTKQWYTGQESRDLPPIYLDEKHRSVCLEDVKLPERSLVKGAKFVIKDGLICISLLPSNLDEDNNLHNVQNELWYSRINDTTLTRMELKLNEVDASEFAPTGTAEANEELSKSGNFYMKFQPSDFKKDASQTTVPYLDIQEVVTDPPMPIQGVGIYYKGVEGYGGFFSLKLLTGKFNFPINPQNIDNEFEIINLIVNLYKKL